MIENNFEKFTNPPIHEAVLIFNFSQELPFEKIQKFAEDSVIKKSFPVIRKTMLHNFMVTATGPNKIENNVQNMQDGYLFRKEDGQSQFTVQFKRQGITFHNLKKYATWEKLTAEFKILVDEITRILNLDIKLKDIGIRYINKIPIVREEPLENYFELIPPAPPGISRKLNRFFLQTGFNEGDFDELIIQTISQESGQLFYIIDLRVARKLNKLELKDPDVWITLSNIRNLKNRLFFSIIKENVKPKFR